ncbi:MAG: hypothetical protein ABI663_02510 [Chryseolinea sp.]
MVNRLIIIVCFVLPLNAKAQVLDFGIPEKLSLSVNSEAEESMPLLSPDGKILFFTRALYTENVGGKYTGHDIWISEQIGKDWKKADNRKAGLNNKNNNVVIGVSGSGDVLYLMDASSSKKVGGVYFSKRTSGAWSEREFIPIAGIESNGFLNFYMSPDFDVLFISMKGKDTKGEEDLYVSIKEASGEWSKPKNLGPTINTTGFEISPFLSDDKKRLYFSSNGHQGMGDADIFVSDRLYGSWEAWSVPQNLGKVINSEKFDAYFSTYGDSVCFFSSNRAGTSSDIYASYWNSSRRREMQKREVDRLIEESKSLLSEVREGTNKISIYTELQVLTFNESELSAGSKKALTTEAPKIKEKNSRVAILGSLKPEFTRSSSLFSKVIKSELVKLGVQETRIIIPTGEDKILDDDELQSRLMTLPRNQLLLVLLP